MPSGLEKMALKKLRSEPSFSLKAGKQAGTVRARHAKIKSDNQGRVWPLEANEVILAYFFAALNFLFLFFSRKKERQQISLPVEYTMLLETGYLKQLKIHKQILYFK